MKLRIEMPHATESRRIDFIDVELNDGAPDSDEDVRARRAWESFDDATRRSLAIFALSSSLQRHPETWSVTLLD